MTLDPSRVLLTDRVAIVTGAAAGLGRAIALGLARFGADVGVCDRDADALSALARELQRLGRQTVEGVLDVREAEAVTEFVSRVETGIGPPSVLVNNAGGGFRAAFLDVNEKGQDALIRENFTSVGHFVRAVVPRMPASGGSIVNVTSIEAFRAAPGYAIYSAMKAAVENLTKSLALELADRNVRVNCIAPDMLPTLGIGDLPRDRTPLPGPGHPDDAAAAVLYLASDLSRFVTGTTLHVDGGNHAAGGWKRTPDGNFEA